jgi:hypothetical protein
MTFRCDGRGCQNTAETDFSKKTCDEAEPDDWLEASKWWLRLPFQTKHQKAWELGCIYLCPTCIKKFERMLDDGALSIGREIQMYSGVREAEVANHG